MTHAVHIKHTHHRLSWTPSCRMGRLLSGLLQPMVSLEPTGLARPMRSPRGMGRHTRWGRRMTQAMMSPSQQPMG